MADVDWVAVQGVGTLMAAAIAVIAYVSAKRSAAEDRRRDEAQAKLDVKQGENFAMLAEAVRKMADAHERNLLDLAARVSGLEASRDPARAQQRRAESEGAAEGVRREWRDLEAHLDTIVLSSRDAMAGAPPGAGEPKRVIRFSMGRKGKRPS